MCRLVSLIKEKKKEKRGDESRRLQELMFYWWRWCVCRACLGLETPFWSSFIRGCSIFISTVSPLFCLRIGPTFIFFLSLSRLLRRTPLALWTPLFPWRLVIILTIIIIIIAWSASVRIVTFGNWEPDEVFQANRVGYSLEKSTLKVSHKTLGWW